MSFRGVHLLQTAYQPRFSAVLDTVLDVPGPMPWIQGFPAVRGRIGGYRTTVTAGGRPVGDAYCQKDCPEPSAPLPRSQGRTPPARPGLRGQLAMVGGLC